MAYTFKGTGITGTSTTAKVFKKSGVKSAKVNNTYLNTSTGHVYKCTTKGGPKSAKWKYDHTDIVGKPNTAYSSLGAPVRGENDHKMTATWKVPNGITDTQNGFRATGQEIEWTLQIKGKDPKKVKESKNESNTTSTVNLNSFKVGETTYTRDSFYPAQGAPKLNSVTVSVKPTNANGEGTAVSATREFKAPRKPTIDEFTFDPSNGRVSTTIRTDAGADYQERRDTAYKVEVYDSRTGKSTTARDTSSTSTEIAVSYDPSDYGALTYRDYIRITVTAYARGYAGDSDTVSSVFYVSYPAQTTIKAVKSTGRTASDNCVVTIATNHTAEHPVDGVKLEYLANTVYARAEDIPGSAQFSSSDVADDANCQALAINVSELLPEQGKYTWIRVKSWHADETRLARYSSYVRVTDLESPAPSAADDYVTILETTAGADGKSAVVLLGWNRDGQDDSTGTELTWDTDEDAWKSTKEPSNYTFTWSDGSIIRSGVRYHDSAKITIKDLDEGEKYYIRARRYLDGDTETYSPYSNIATVLTSAQPSAVVATCERYVAAGKSLDIRWTLSGNGLQKEWQVVASSGAVIASGSGSIGSAQISATRLARFAVNNVVTLAVKVSTGSGFVTSEQHKVSIVREPSISVSCPELLTAQPCQFDVTSSSICDLIIIVAACGCHGQFPEGIKRQAAGDTIYSARISPVWTAMNANSFTTTVTLPPGLDFWELGGYVLSVTAVDRLTGLRSVCIHGLFDVLWAHQAVDPTDFVTVEPYVEVEEEGEFTEMGVQITLTPPTGSASTDFYDIYRLTGDGAMLIGESFPLNYVAIDKYAPFGDNITHHYRVAHRTADGDVAFADIEYVLPGAFIRFDWRDGSLQFPYNLKLSDAYTKDAEIRKHLDGTNDGYWNQNVERHASLSTDVVRLLQQTDIDMTRRLARYAGPVFVRTPEGLAFEADVQVTDMSADKESLTSVAFDATEVGLTDEFILPTPYELEGETP